MHTNFKLTGNAGFMALIKPDSETLYLHSGQDGVLTGYSDQENFGASETGIAFGRYQKSTGTYNFVPMSQNTPGSANAYPRVGPIVISEIMYNPVSGNQNEEYIELLNISDSVIRLSEYDPSTTLRVKSFFMPSGDEAYPAAASDIRIFEWGAGRLNNAGEKIQLSKPGDQVDDRRYYIRVDRVNYSDGSHPAGEDPWPTEPDGQGKSLMRKVLADYGNDPANWIAANPSPGE